MDMNTIQFSTRNNEGIVAQHPSLHEALEAFVQQDGYRLDFYFPDKRILHIYRDEFQDPTVNGSKSLHPAFANYFESLSKVLYYNPDASFASTDNSNVIHVDFT